MFDIAKAKKFFIFALIGSLIVSALVAIVTVLIGEFTEVTYRVFLTLFMAIIHSLVSLLFIWDDSRRNTFTKLAFFINTIFILVILSFVTSLFGIWKLISSDVAWNFYQMYFLIGFCALHADILSKALRKEKYIDSVICANYVFIAVVFLMFCPIIFLDNPTEVLGEMYFRILAAAGIVDGTLSLLTIIFYKLYMHKHPEVAQETDKPARRGLSIWIWILIIYLFFQIIGPIFFLFGRSFLW